MKIYSRSSKDFETLTCTLHNKRLLYAELSNEDYGSFQISKI